MTATMRPPLPTVTRVVPIVELGVGSVNEPAGTALWQPGPGSDIHESNWQHDTSGTGQNAATSRWSGRDPMWVDASCHVRDVSTFCGRERSIDLWEVGTATITVDNVSGWADYPHPNPDEQVLAMRPGIPVRIGVLVDGVDVHYLWGGYVDSMQPGYHPEDGEFVVLECIDAKGEVGRGTLAELATPVGAGQTSSQRVHSILTAAKWPAWRRDIQSNAVELNPTIYGAQVVDLLNLAADSSGGACFGDVNGNVAFRQRDWQASSILAAPAGIIGNAGGGGVQIVDIDETPPGSGLVDPITENIDVVEDTPGLFDYVGDNYDLVAIPAGSQLYALDANTTPTVCPTEWELSFAREDISTRVIVGRDGETPIAEARDAQGFSLFGDETYERTDLQTHLTAELINIRDRVLAVRRYAVTIPDPDDPADESLQRVVHNMPRIAAVSIDCAADPEAVDLLAVVSPYIPSVVACHHDGIDGRTVINRMMMVVGVEHELSPEGWSARLALDSAFPYQLTATNGRWNAPGGTGGYWQHDPPTLPTPPAIVTTWSPGV